MPEAVNEIDAQASDWAVRVAEGTLTSADAIYLEQWLSADTRHRGAFVRAQAGWRALSRVARTQGVAPEAVATEPEAATAPRFTRRRLLAGAAAAGVAALVGGRLFLAERAVAYASDVGEVRRVVLADGSTATIGSRSSISATMRADERALTLEEGEAWFDVAPNPRRPFVVSAGDVRVRAVGTAFSVSQSAGGIDLLVSEGIVEAWRGDGTRQRVAAGQSLRFADAGTAAAPETLGREEITRRLAWRQGLLILDGEPLAAAAARFNRYNRTRIEITDPALGEIRLTGRFKSSEALAFATAAATVANARVERDGERIVLRR